MVSHLVPRQVLVVVIVTVLEAPIWMMDQQRRETEIAAAAVVAAVHAALQGRCVALSAGSKVEKMLTQLRVARLAVPVPQH